MHLLRALRLYTLPYALRARTACCSARLLCRARHLCCCCARCRHLRQHRLLPLRTAPAALAARRASRCRMLLLRHLRLLAPLRACCCWHLLRICCYLGGMALAGGIAANLAKYEAATGGNSNTINISQLMRWRHRLCRRRGAWHSRLDISTAMSLILPPLSAAVHQRSGRRRVTAYKWRA